LLNIGGILSADIHTIRTNCDASPLATWAILEGHHLTEVCERRPFCTKKLHRRLKSWGVPVRIGPPQILRLHDHCHDALSRTFDYSRAPGQPEFTCVPAVRVEDADPTEDWIPDKEAVGCALSHPGQTPEFPRPASFPANILEQSTLLAEHAQRQTAGISDKDSAPRQERAGCGIVDRWIADPSLPDDIDGDRWLDQVRLIGTGARH